MNAFSYSSATSTEAALEAHSGRTGTAYLAGGTNLLDNWKLGVEQPDHLVDVRHIGLDQITELPNGNLQIGSGVSNSRLAYDDRIRTRFPVLSSAILAGASPQLRNAATTAGNLLQRTRCPYFRDGARACNKRNAGSGCAALNGINRGHAILGTSNQCIATHPSDMCVALMTLDAVVRTQTARTVRSVPLANFYVSYGDDPGKESVLEPGELITAVELPATSWFTRSTYVKARDRSSYEFALASAAVALHLADGVIQDCRVSLGGVATKPWRAFAAEQVLRGNKPSAGLWKQAGEAELKAAIPRAGNAFKVPLCQRVLSQSLQEAVQKA